MCEWTVVPTLNEYADKPGYYIRARPSSVASPITYQIRSEGYAVIDSYRVSDGDQISWSVIKSLKSLGLLYTDETGVIGTDEFDPDPSQLEETTLDEDAARQLAEVIAETLDIDEKEMRVILGILNIDPSTFDLPGSSTTSGFPTPPGHSTTPDFPVDDSINVIDGETIYKTDDWWKAAVLTSGYNQQEVMVYLWLNDGQSWKRKQKYKVKADDWTDERATIDRLLS